jgi:acyl-CoA reductase-like NAD-dependent aldehyde dehydrogenase
MAVGNSSRMTIDGAAVESEATFDVVNPSTGEVFATAPDCSDAQLEAAMTSAATAFAQWKTDDGARRAVLHKAAGALEDASELIAAIVTSEVGKPLREARGEIVGAAHWLRYYADLVLEPEIVQDDENARISVVRRPLGPVAAITPWNFPLLLSFWKIAPALAAGNTLVLKPSPYTPLSALKAGEVLSGISSGGRAAAGGHALDRAGNYYAPTIVADVTDGTPLVDSEQFGPALPLISYRDVRDAVAAANATHYGLGGSVWGADMGQVAAIANQMDCGVVWTNTHKVLTPATPFGGSKWSGLGVENGPWGLYGMTELQMVWNKH